MGRAHKQIELTPDDFDTGELSPLNDNIVRRATTVEISKLHKTAFARVKKRRDLQQGDRNEDIAARADQSRGADVARADRQECLARRRITQGRIDDGVVRATDHAAYVARLADDMAHNTDFNRRVGRTREFFSLLTSNKTPPALLQEIRAHLGAMAVPEWRQMIRSYVEASAADQCSPDVLLTQFFRHGHPQVALDAATAFDILLVMVDKRHDVAQRAAVFTGMPSYAYAIQQRRMAAECEAGPAAVDDWMFPGDLAVFCRSFLQPAEAQAGVTPRRRRSRVMRSVPSYPDLTLEAAARKAINDLGLGISKTASNAERRPYRLVRTTAIRALVDARAKHNAAPMIGDDASADMLPPIPPVEMPQTRKRRPRRSPA